MNCGQIAYQIDLTEIVWSDDYADLDAGEPIDENWFDKYVGVGSGLVVSIREVENSIKGQNLGKKGITVYSGGTFGKICRTKVDALQNEIERLREEASRHMRVADWAERQIARFHEDNSQSK